MKHTRHRLVITLQIIFLSLSVSFAAAQDRQDATTPVQPGQQDPKAQGAETKPGSPANGKSTGEKKKSEPSEEKDKDACNSAAEEDQYTDCRGVFFSDFYIGLAIDTFAGDDMLKYLNPGDSGKIHERAIGGIDFEYRLLGEAKPVKPGLAALSGDDTKKGDSAPSPQTGQPGANTKGQGSEVKWHPKNLWIYGETMHGVRSADVDCTKNPKLPVCESAPTIPTNPGEQVYYILRNATSLEGHFGFRWEFLGLQQKSWSPANLYLKGQAGFLSVAGAGTGALDLDHVALGAVATKGKYENSHLEVGYGRSDIFATARRKRVKVDGYLQRRFPDVTGWSALSLFVQLFVDSDLGRGSDAIQSYVGLNFDLGKLFSIKKSDDSGKKPEHAGGGDAAQPAPEPVGPKR